MKWKQFFPLLLVIYFDYCFGKNRELKGQPLSKDKKVVKQKPPEKKQSELLKTDLSHQKKFTLLVIQNRSNAHTTMYQQLAALMKNISDHAIMAANNDRTIFKNISHIGEVPNEMMDFATAATIPGVKTICEVGFNAGHSTAVFLLSNPLSQFISFDLGLLVWSAAQVNYISSLFPNRLTYVKGNSQVKVKEYAAANPSVKCDLWSIDGDHGRGAELDFKGAVLMSARRSLVLADDHTTNFPAVKEIWNEWEVSNPYIAKAMMASTTVTPRAGASAASFSLPRKVKQQVTHPKKR